MISTAAVRRVLPAAFVALAVVAIAILAAAFSAASPAQADNPYSVSGTVTAQSTELGTATPLAGIVVRLYAEPSGNFVDETTTAGDGTYVISFIPVDPTADYSLQFNCSDPGVVACDLGHTTQWLGGHGTQSAADTFTLSPDVTNATRDALLDSASGNGAVELDSPSISGTPSVGQVLQANLVSATPPEPMLTYRWFSNGVEVQHGTAATYTIQPSDFAQQISVTITGSAFGYSPTDATTPPTNAINGVFTPGVPTITAEGGSFVVGSTLTADAGTWTPSGASFSYQWLSNATVVQDGTDATYTPTPADHGNTITVKVTASEAGYDSSSVTSVATDQIGDGALVPGSVTINPDSSGLVVGATLTATSTAWAPGDVTLSYQWVRGAVGDIPAVDIAGATSSTYTLGAADFGAPISVRVTGSESDYTSQSVASAETTAIAAGSLNSPPTATIDDTTPTFGDTLNATTASWGPGDVTLSCEWFRGGVDTNVTTCAYPVGLADVGKPLHVVITGSEAGYISATSTSADTANVATASLTSVRPTISGTSTFGNTLHASTASWGPGTVAVSFEWFRNNVDTGVSGASYPLTDSDLSATIFVRATGTQAGFTTAVVDSDQTAPVAAGTLTTTVPTIAGTLTAGSTLTATAAPWGPGTVALTYQWVKGTTDIPSATAATYRLTGSDVGATISVRVTGTELDYTTTSTTSAQTTAIGVGTLTSTTPTISGTVSVGSTLTASAASWGPGTVALTYQWINSVTGDIPGATTTSYVVTQGDYQAKLSVRVTGTKGGYTTASVTSAQTAQVAAGALIARTPTITGSATVGLPLTAVPGVWGPGTVALAYQWVNSATGDIPSATSSTYTPVVGDLGATISVRVTGTETGYTTTSAISASTATVGQGALTAGTPTITGTAQYNSTLTANTDAANWGPGAVTFTYQWRSNNVPIPGATSSTYPPAVPDVGATITVAITGAETGYTSTTRTSTGVIISPANFSLSPVPSVSPPTSIHHVLNANTSGWSPQPDAFTYIWLRDGSIISGAPDAPSYQLTPDDIGHTFSLQVTGHKGGYTPLQPAVSAPTDVIPLFAGLFTNTVPPSITGTDQVGSTLTANSGSWDPTPDHVDFLWQRGTGDPNGDGYSAIAGATQSTYVLAPADANLSITVRVTVTKISGYKSLTNAAAETDPIQEGELTTTSPTISGSPTVGSTLTAVTPGWGPGTVNFGYIWKHGSTPITGATASTYTVAAADLNSQISVQVTGSETGYNSSIQTSASTAQIGPGSFSSTPAPTIAGTVAPGNILTAVDPTWSPASSFTYQWLRDGNALTGATSKTYLVDPLDKDAKLTVQVTSTLPGYIERSQTSLPTTTVGAAVLPALPRPTITGTARVGSTLSVAAPHLSISPVGLTFTYRWRTGTTLLQTSTAGTYIPTHSDVGHTISVYIVASASGYLATSTSPTSSSTAKVVVGSLTAPTPTISGTAKVNNTLTAITGAWTAGSTLKYQWYRSGIAITGKTAPTYLTTGSDYRHTITVKVSGSLSGYTSAWRMSHSTATIVAGTITTATPTITGTLAYPSTLTANRGTWGPGSISFSYQWYYTSSSGMHAITNAVHSTYAPSSAYAGLTITVHIRGSKSGYTSATRTASVQYARGTFTTATPTILGTPDVGSTLTASRGAWSPTSSVTFSYQWYCGTDVSARVAISGATASTFVVPSSLLGKTVWVTVRSSRSGFTTAGPVLSAASGPIAPKP